MDEYPLKIRYALEAAKVLGLTAEIVDPFSNYIAKISRGKHFVFVGSGNVQSYPINNSTIASIATDKAHTYFLLERAGVDVPKSQLIFVDDRFADMRPPGRDVAEALRFAATLGYPVFVKPNQGSRGAFAQSVNNPEELKAHLEAIAAHYYSAVVQEYLQGQERRIFYIDGEPVFAYSKTRPKIVADGSCSVETLLDGMDETLRRSGLSPTNRLDPVLRSFLEQEAMSLSDIPAAGTEIEFSEKANVSWGGGVIGFRERFTPSEIELCRTVFDNTGLRVCAIDLIAVGDSEKGRDIVLELNANPALSTLERLAKVELLTTIWTSILQKALLP